MASTADFFEVALARRGIADEDVQLGQRLRSGWPSLAPCLTQDAMDVLGNREHVFFREMKRGHRAHRALAAVADDGNDILAVLIGEDDLRPQQVRPALIAAAQVGAVAGATAHAVECPAARDHRRIAGRALLLRKVGALSAALTSGPGRGRAALRAGAATLLSGAGGRVL